MPSGYFHFIRHQWSILLFGFLAVFWGNFGQSFFVGLFGASIQSSLNLSAAEYGKAYAIATLGSAVTVVWAGKVIDTIRLSYFVAFVAAGLGLACILLSFANAAFVLVIGFYFLRLFGQALFPHSGSTTIARVFTTHRGKALSITSTGFPAGEIVLPLLAVMLINQFGWAATYRGTGIFVLLVVLPLMLWLIKFSELEVQLASIPSNNVTATKTDGRIALITDYRYWLALPGLMAGPFIATGIFIQLPFVLEQKQWSVEWYSICFIVYGIVHWISSLVSGYLVDRWSATKLLPFMVVPLAAALLSAAYLHGDWVVLVMLALMAIGIGASPPITGSLWPEIYGLQQIGAIRSVNVAVMVFATAAAPYLFGIIIDAGISLPTLFTAFFFIISAAFLGLYFSYSAHPEPHPIANQE